MLCSALRYACPLATLLLLGLPRAVSAQNPYFPGNATIHTDVIGAIIGYPNERDYIKRTSRTSPAVTLVNGGSIRLSLIAYNSSAVIVKGGSIRHDLVAFDSSNITLRGGSVGDNVNAYGSSKITVSGGSIGKSLLVSQNSTLNLIGTGLRKTPAKLNARESKYDQYTLAGTLSDGTSLDGKTLFVEKNVGARANFIAPSSKSSAPLTPSLHSAPGTHTRQGRRL